MFGREPRRPVRFACVSAESSTFDSAANESRTFELRSHLDSAGLQCIPATGSWEGREEASFLVPVPTDDSLKTVLGWADHFGQSAVLVVDEEGTARLYAGPYWDSGLAMGKWRAVSAEKARTQQGWTLVNGVYHAVSF